MRHCSALAALQMSFRLIVKSAHCRYAAKLGGVKTYSSEFSREMSATSLNESVVPDMHSSPEGIRFAVGSELQVLGIEKLDERLDFWTKASATLVLFGDCAIVSICCFVDAVAHCWRIRL